MTGGEIHILFGAEVEVGAKDAVVGVCEVSPDIANLLEAVVESAVTLVELAEKLAKQLSVTCVLSEKEAGNTANGDKKRGCNVPRLKEGQRKNGQAAEAKHQWKLRSVLQVKPSYIRTGKSD